jgi:hypothetical protein
VTESSRLDARYGRRPGNPTRRRLLTALGLAVLVGLAVLLYAWRSGNGLQYAVSGYHAVSDAEFTVTFSVEKAAGQRVSCRIVAKNQYTDVVGSVDVDLPAAGAQLGRTVVFKTRELGIVGVIDSCRVLG